MGARGPVPKSAAEREYEGGAAHRPLPKGRPPVAFGGLEPPKGMPAGAKRLWQFYVEQMAMQGTLRPIDAPSLEALCVLHADLQQLEREKRRLVATRKRSAKAAGRKIEGGALLEFEMTREARRLETTITSRRSHLQRLCDRYGLNPMAGSRLQSFEGGFVPPPVDTTKNEVEELIN